MKRDEMIGRLDDRKRGFDVVVIGGGATGLGIAVDAASRGHACALFERSDFGKGTSSRSTKLAHGGVRYLQQGNVALVMEALRERGRLRRNAPHLVHDLAFVVPSYDWWESPFYGIGLKVYDALAGKYGFGRSKHLSKEHVIQAIPTIEEEGLRGGTLYYDGQFDDARLAIDLAKTAADQGAAVINYMAVHAFVKDGSGRITGVRVRDEEAGDERDVRARVVVNATGPFTDEVRRLDRAKAEEMIAPSQGAHIVLDRSFLPGDAAIMVPRTDDGRVMFAIPWRGRVIVGTTDTPIEGVPIEPEATQAEIDFIIETANRYLEKDVSPADVLSVFTGVRPLVKSGGVEKTAALSRDHTIHIDPLSGLLTIAGGKWTTYRRMAEQVVDHVETLGELDQRPCRTKSLRIHGAATMAEEPLGVYGADRDAIEALIRSDRALGERLHERLDVCAGEVVWSAREEMSMTVDDALSRRTRSILFDARAAREAAPAVASLLAKELGRDDTWRRAQVQEFEEIARRHMLT